MFLICQCFRLKYLEYVLSLKSVGPAQADQQNHWLQRCLIKTVDLKPTDYDTEKMLNAIEDEIYRLDVYFETS